MRGGVVLFARLAALARVRRLTVVGFELCLARGCSGLVYHSHLGLGWELGRHGAPLVGDQVPHVVRRVVFMGVVRHISLLREGHDALESRLGGRVALLVTRRH